MLVINLFKEKRKKGVGVGEYGLIRSNWDPERYPFPPTRGVGGKEEE
jgi:hypothetical protein